MTAHDNLSNYYKVLFDLSFHHKYNIHDLEDLIVYELDIYLDHLNAFMREQELQQETKFGVPL